MPPSQRDSGPKVIVTEFWDKLIQVHKTVAECQKCGQVTLFHVTVADQLKEHTFTPCQC